MQATVIVVIDGAVIYSIGNATEHTSTAAHLHNTKLTPESISTINRAIDAVKNELSSLQDFDGVPNGCGSSSQIDSDIPVPIVRDSQ
jgi:hypothetical protein